VKLTASIANKCDQQAVALREEVSALESGQFQNGTETGVTPVSGEILRRVLFTQTLREGLRPVTQNSTATELSMRVPAARLSEAFGGNTNLHVLVPAQSQLNRVKGRIASGVVIIGATKLRRLTENSAAGNVTAQEELSRTFDVVSFHGASKTGLDINMMFSR
jgi:aryl-alcohol dehydrogenase-like predicted oxidoreductase